MRRRVIPFLLALILALTLPGTVHAARDYQAQSFNVDIQIEPENTLLITETITFSFQGGPFTFVYRELPYTGLDRLEIVSAAMDGVTLPAGSTSGQVETIESNNSLRVTWHFASTQNSIHVFKLSYRVLGAIRQDPTGDLLSWRAIPENHDYPIQTSQVMLHYAEDLSPVVSSQSPKIDTNVETSTGNTIFSAAAISTDTEWVIRAVFPGGSLITTPPQWQTNQSAFDNRVEAALPLTIAATIGSLLVGLCAVILTSMRRRRVKPDYPDIETAMPPSDLAPAMVGALYHPSAEPAWQQISATLFEMAEQKLVTFEPLEKSRWAAQDFLIRLASPLPPLTPEQKALIQILFTHKGERFSEVKTSQFSGIFAGGWKEFTHTVQDDLLKRGLIDPIRIATHRRWLNTSLLWALVSGLLFVAALVWSGLSSGKADWEIFSFALILMGFSVGQFLSALLSIIVSSNYSVLADAGLEAVEKWNGFRKSLEAACRGQNSSYIPDMFAAYLPYAVTFGLGRDWMKSFERSRSGMLPSWLAVGADAAMDGSGMEVLGALMVITSSSSNSSSAGDAGAAAASGGGSSGAG